MHILLMLLLLLQRQDPAQSSVQSTKEAQSLPFRKEAVGDMQAQGVDVHGAFVGIPVRVDSAFAAKHEIDSLSASFSVVIPKDKGVLLLPGGQKTGVPEVIRLSVGTEDGKAVEILRFTSLSLPQLGSPRERLLLCEETLRDKVLAIVTDGYEEAKFLESYATKVGSYDAVCLHAHMKKPQTGEHYAVKLVGILNPKQEGSILAFLMADTSLSEIKARSDLSSKGIGLKVIHSLKFLQSSSEELSEKPSSEEVKPDSAEALKQLAGRLRQGYADRDAELVKRITLELLPTEEQIQKALSPAITEADRAAVLSLHNSLPKDDESLLGLVSMRSGQTKIMVHAATTEQLAGKSAAPESLPEFPGGAIQAAKKGMLRPGMTFFEVEYLEPSKDVGIKYHLFFWNGDSWSMLGPVWRSIGK